MGALFDALRTVEFLDGAGDDIVTSFMVIGNSADQSKGHLFWRAGTQPEFLVVPVTGEVKTSTCTTDDREFIDRFPGFGDCVGLPSALDGLPHATDARVTRTGEFFTMRRRGLLRFLDQHPAIRTKATEMVGALYRRAMKEREDVALRSVPQRVAEFLLRQGCTREADGARVLVHLTQAEIAARLGTVREVVSRVFADLKQRGLVDRDDDDGMLIPDWTGLEAEANAGRGDGPAGRAAEPTHETRTRRFFAPMAERRRRHEPVEDATSCRERLGDLSRCCARGCPAALEDPMSRPLAAVSRWRAAVAARSGAAAPILHRA